MFTPIRESEFERRIGGVFMAGIPGMVMDAQTERLIRDYALGGVILFSRNIHNPLQLASLCNDLQNCSLTHHGTPLFLAVDQEGGRVARLREPFTVFPGNEGISNDPDPLSRAVEFARVTAKEMQLVGLNMDFAPVLDVLGRVAEKHLEGRTFGNDSERVARLGRTIVKTLQENGIMATGKHFPGLGKATLDPHLQLPIISLEGKEILDNELLPFRAAIEEGVCAVMTSHAVYPALDPVNPATLSKKILTGLLRMSLGFNGLIVSDDLEMGAICKKWGVAEAAMASFEAGADILLICKDQEAVVQGIEVLKRKVLDGGVPIQKLRQSLERIWKVKSEFLKGSKIASLREVRAYFRL
jgi:beta-N-acetylhexosaminidase